MAIRISIRHTGPAGLRPWDVPAPAAELRLVGKEGEGAPPSIYTRDRAEGRIGGDRGV